MKSKLVGQVDSSPKLPWKEIIIPGYPSGALLSIISHLTFLVAPILAYLLMNIDN